MITRHTDLVTVPSVARFLAWWTGRVELIGAERLPRRGPALVVANHTTIADVPIVLSSLDRHGLKPISSHAPGHTPECTDHAHVRFLATQEVFDHRILGPIVRRSGFISVQPSVSERLGAYEQAEAALRDGEIVAIYPEGDVTSPDDGAPRRLRSGAARMALATNVPIVPIAHHDARDIGQGTEAETLRAAFTAIWRRPKIVMVVGRQIEPGEYAGMLPLDVTRLIRERLIETWQQARDLRDARRR
jgi:1-acyl-sn-glycerol-3-phosphate acyltransferase